MKLRTMIKAAMATGAASLVVSGGAWAAAVPLTTLSAHSQTNPNTATPLDYATNSAGYLSGANYDANGNLTSAAPMMPYCGVSGVTCTLLDGSGDGMLQYLVKNTNNGKTFIELIVGEKTADDGVFTNESFVTYNGNGGLQANSIANKSIITDPLALASAEGGFTLKSEWLRGAFQTSTASWFCSTGAASSSCGNSTNAYVNTGAGVGNNAAAPIRIDAITDVLINGVQAFHYTGLTEENGAPGATGAGASIVADIAIDQGTSAATQTASAADAQAMGVFAYRSTGGTYAASVSPVNYSPTATTITLGTGSVSVAPTNGVRAVYVGQQMFGFNGSQTDSYATDDRTKRDFGYVKYTVSNGAPDMGFGAWVSSTATTDPNLWPVIHPEIGSGRGLASIAMSSQVGANAIVGGSTAAVNLTAREADYLSGVPNGNNVNDFTTAGAGGRFVNSAGLLGAWSTLFSTVQTGAGNIGTTPTNVDNGF